MAAKSENAQTASRRVAVLARQLRTSGVAASQIGPKMSATNGLSYKYLAGAAIAALAAGSIYTSLPKKPFLVAEDVARAAGDISGLRVIVTGANAGIGKETARVLAQHGAHVVLACRNPAKVERAQADIRARLLNEGGTGAVEVMILDLSSLQSVRQFAKEYTATGYPLHVLVANAGVNVDEQQKSADGLELVSAVNWLGHFYLATLLRPLMEASSTASRRARVVHVSSQAHKFVGVPWFGPSDPMKWLDDWQFEKEGRYQGMAAYAQSKFMQIAGSNEMNRRWSPAVLSHSVHPGNIKTQMYEKGTGILKFILFNVWPFSAWVRTVGEGAAAQVAAAVDPTYGDPERGGAYICNDEAFYERLGGVHRPEVMRRVWDISEKTIKDLGFSLTLEDEKSKI